MCACTILTLFPVLMILFENVRLSDLLRAMQCSRTLFRLAHDPELWRRRYRMHFADEW